jgi:hypothetical protein
MADPNQHIVEFLDYYFQLPVQPEYAVLLKGPWGGGKTWFVRQMVDRLTEGNQKSLYVSLYGLSTTQSIDQELFRQLHPILGSKAAVFIGRFARGAIKGATHIDINADGNDDVSVDVNLEGASLPKWMIEGKEAILIFDDLERCAMPLQVVLGYINNFVEHAGRKVVIVADEDKMIARESHLQEDDSLAYKKIKEKLIGKTFRVAANLDGAVAAFMSQIASQAAKQAFEDNAESVRQLFNASGYQNLRHLRQALLELDRLIHGLDPKVQAVKALVEHLIRMFLIYSFEIRGGNIAPEQIKDIGRGFYTRFAGSENKQQENIYTKLSAKYPGIPLYNSLLPEMLWYEILANGHIDYDQIHAALDKSSYFASKNQPEWVRLWHWFDLNDHEAETFLRAVMLKVKKREYEEIGVVLHVFGMMIWFAEIGALPTTNSTLVADAKSYIDHLKQLGKLMSPSRIAMQRIMDHQSANGLGFQSYDSSEFRSITAHLERRRQEVQDEGFPEEAQALLDLMNTDIDTFVRRLINCNHTDCLYPDVPILRHIDKNSFVTKFVSLLPGRQGTVRQMFEERYKFDNRKQTLASERSWLLSVAKLLRVEQKKLAGKLSAHSIGSTVGVLENLAKQLPKTKGGVRAASAKKAP